MLELTQQEAEEMVFSNWIESTTDFDEKEITPRYYRTEEDLTAKAVCGGDERIKVTTTTTMPYKAICKLYMKSPSGKKNYIGTGWLTHTNKLYTAGHCVYDRKEKGWMKSIIVVPGKSGKAEPYGRYYASAFTTTRGWKEKGIPRYDMGAIKISSDVSHSDVLTPMLEDPVRGEICGYPADRDTGTFQYRMEDSLRKAGGQFKYMLDTYGGQSGSPLLKDRSVAVGIHNYGGCPNSASDLYQLFVNTVDQW